MLDDLPWHAHYEDEEDENSVYTIEEMVYLMDSDDDDSIEEIDHEGSWANPIDLTGSDIDGETDDETMSESDESDNELYLE